ncbi:hypothetical protein [Mangrovicoccus sp. HB161399]|uniref:hypothetical protein n=1 Tax=Mangrovicoccus sp. HB161399 TaxID=2720392 RepID=UPI001552E963|nr:hypothetical protein [Mangrovicoccus sp. HB161399]
MDLDGTLVDTNSCKFHDIKHGRDRQFSLADIPSIPGAEEFVETLRERCDSILIVSDSHGAYVGRVAEERFGLPWLALADKPNIANLRSFLAERMGFPLQHVPEEFLFVGDTKLDVQLARGLWIPSVMLDLWHYGAPNRDQPDPSSDRAKRIQEGATYYCRSFDEVLGILDNPAEKRYVLEDPKGRSSARLRTDENWRDGVTVIRALAREQQGPCDAYGARMRSRQFQSEDRTDDFLRRISRDVSLYLREEVLTEGKFSWDLATCVADKTTTKPPRKMANFLQALDVDVPKAELFSWLPDVQGSIRHQPKRDDRTKFVRQFVRLDPAANLHGKSVIVFDDQYTTGATAVAHADMLLEAGARNVLFVALFFLVNDVPIERSCPRCGKAGTVRIRYRKKDGGAFYSCVPPEYRGKGCGWVGNIG